MFSDYVLFKVFSVMHNLLWNFGCVNLFRFLLLEILSINGYRFKIFRVYYRTSLHVMLSSRLVSILVIFSLKFMNDELRFAFAYQNVFLCSCMRMFRAWCDQIGLVYVWFC